MSLLLKGNIFIIISIFELLFFFQKLAARWMHKWIKNNEQKCLKRMLEGKVGIMLEVERNRWQLLVKEKHL